MSESNQVAQIIANEADKALGVRPNGKPKPHDFAAAEAIAAAFLLIPRDELPKTRIMDRNGSPHVEVEGAEAGLWPANNSHAHNRKWGLEYLAASEAMKEWQAVERRSEVARELTGNPETRYSDFNPEGALAKAINRIINLEAQNANS